MPDPKLAKELFSRIYEGAMTPLAPEWEESQDESTLVSGGEFGRNNKLVNKVWPGGAHIPGLREVYNEGLRPLTSVLGLFSEGMARGGGNMKAPAAGIVRTPEGIILKEESAGLLSKLLGRLKQGESLENIPLAERQKAMGMDDVVYHGTKNPFVPRGLITREGTLSKGDEYKMLKPNQGVDFDYGIHADHDPVVAHTAISANKILNGDVESGRYATGDRVLPLRARVANSLELPDLGKWNDPFGALNKIPRNTENLQQREIREAAEEVLRKTGGMNKYGGIVPLKQEAAMEQWAETFPEILKKNGYDSVKYTNTNEGTGKHSTMLLDSNQVRMPWAKFDPRKMLAGDLLAFNQNQNSPSRAGAEVTRLLKLRMARQAMDKVKEKGSQWLDEAIDYKLSLMPVGKRTEDIELK